MTIAKSTTRRKHRRADSTTGAASTPRGEHGARHDRKADPKPATSASPPSADPVLIAYTARRVGAKKRKIWTRIGQAFPHETGAGLTLILDLIPLDGVVILLERYDDDDAWLLGKGASSPKRPTAP